MSIEKRREIALEKLLERVGSMYKLVILAARRALELSEGSPKMVEASPRDKPAEVALREIMEGKLTWRPKKQTKEKQ